MPEQSRESRDDGEADAILYIGIDGGIEEQLARGAGIDFRSIQSGQLRGMVPWTATASLLKMVKGSRQARQQIADFKPDVVFVTGGFVTGPVVWAAWRAGIPVLIYLPDIEPGLAIRRLSRFALSVAVTFPEVAEHFPGKAVVTGYPVRPEILKVARDRMAARHRMGLAGEKPVALVFGGSRGARSINQALAAVLDDLLDRYQVVHITGTLDWQAMQDRIGKLTEAKRQRYHSFPYLHDDMGYALASADLVVARAGASTLGEFPAFGLPSILVPYPYSGQHQDVNADYLVDRGAALKLPDARLEADLLATVVGLLENPEKIRLMGKAAASLAQPDAAGKIAQEIRSLAVGGQ
ncbi:MAG: UDP-N-acetylglucosamine--N-acetylmuramyl-(pentapeptide) pyrophosphoryl-undecaprenol N-acetylglucosamine transferase [Chloroflexota bacterium]|nr:UDP-N-acetylglucosamine--N-acetylmuramyl-(pentapeptide) pyrophosphoryl-undecaprenol N-acetylglucosamine transferase [Chloroflexota bacterium]